jgi:hypothetical protein
MTNKPKGGTLSTKGKADKKSGRPPKQQNVMGRAKSLLGQNKVRVLGHANQRMGQRNVIYYEVLQAISNGRHDPKRDRYSDPDHSWEYSIEGKTNDDRALRIGISFEVNAKTDEMLLIVTVIEPGK